MTEAEANELVRRLEATAAANPQGYRLRVGALAVLGYGYIAVMLLIVVGLLALVILGILSTSARAILIKLTLPFLFLIGAILRAMWVRLEAPNGIPLGRADGPMLWAAVDRLRGELGAPRVHEIQITDAFNAAIVQVPRLGIFGWQRNYLILGLPLLQGLSTKQVEAVIGHELGHLSGQHSRFAGWIYRLRQTWTQLLGRLEEQQSQLGQLLFTRFFGWYAPYFSAYSFVLARADEYVADRCAADVAGPEAARSALTRIAAAAKFLDASHWPAVSRQIAAIPEPPPDVPALAGRALRADATEATLATYLAEAIAEPTGLADTHPSLTDRLRGLEWTAPPEPSWSAPPAPNVDAATELLGPAAAPLAESLGRDWQQRNRDAWGDRHHQLRKVITELQALDAAAAAGPLPAESSWRRLQLAADLDGDRVPGLLTEFVAAHPEHAEGRFVQGRALLGQGDDAGMAHLQEAARLDDDYQVAANRLLAAHLLATAREEDSRHFEAMADERAALIDRAVAERNEVPRDMVLEPSGLPELMLSDFREALRGHPDATEVYLARRRVMIMPEKPCYVLAIKPRRRLGRPVIDEPALIRAVSGAVGWPRTTYTVALVGGNGWLRGVLRKMDTLLIEQ